MVHFAQAQRRVRLAHGGRLGGLHSPLRRALPARSVPRDEKSKQLVGDVRESLPVEPVRVSRHDYEYERNGGRPTSSSSSEPLASWCHVEVTERRTKIDWALCVRELVDVHYPEAQRIVFW
jgi:hypothetical protein